MNKTNQIKTISKECTKSDYIQNPLSKDEINKMKNSIEEWEKGFNIAVIKDFIILAILLAIIIALGGAGGAGGKFSFWFLMVGIGALLGVTMVIGQGFFIKKQSGKFPIRLVIDGRDVFQFSITATPLEELNIIKSIDKLNEETMTFYRNIRNLGRYPTNFEVDMFTEMQKITREV